MSYQNPERQRRAIPNPKRKRGAYNAAGHTSRSLACAAGWWRAFTLVELTVTIGIIAILAVIALPGISRMLEDTRLADAETKVRGLLASARARAIDNKNTGLFFYVEGDVQKVAFIESYDGTESALISADRFRVVPGQTPAQFEKPFRVVPISVLKNGQWSDDELANRDYRNLTSNQGVGNTPDNHRNYFTMIFSKDGRVVADDQVFINDGDEIGDGDNDPPLTPLQNPTDEEAGAVTGLGTRNVTGYQDDNGATQAGAWGAPPGNPAMICDNSSTPVAINFPSVDGLLVYDDSVYAQYPDDSSGGAQGKRAFLLETGRPYYVSRQTGAVIVGPLGGNEPVN